MSPQEIDLLWSIAGKVGAIVVTLAGIVKAYKYLKSQTSVSKLEKRITAHDTCLANDKEEIKAINIHMGEIERRISEDEEKRIIESKQINESLQMLGTSICAMMNHMIDGSEVEDLKKNRDELQNFFIKK